MFGKICNPDNKRVNFVARGLEYPKDTQAWPLLWILVLHKANHSLLARGLEDQTVAFDRPIEDPRCWLSKKCYPHLRV